MRSCAAVEPVRDRRCDRENEGAEEATEVAIEAVRGERRCLKSESADLLYHLVVIWNAMGIKPSDVWGEMKRRERLLGIAEKLPKRLIRN